MIREASRLGALLLSAALGACASSYMLVGTPRLPIPANRVSVFVKAPAMHYEEIAVLETSSAHSLTWSRQRKIDAVIRRLKAQAASLGANGIVLHALAEGAPASIGAGFGAGFVGTHGSVGVGVGGSGTTSDEIGRATAIYLRATPPGTIAP